MWQLNGAVRVNRKGEISVPWSVFVNARPDEIMDVVRKKGTLRTPHTTRPTTRAEGVKQFI